MKILPVLLAFMVLAGCGEASQDRAATTSEPPKPAPSSIMRPEVVEPEPAARRLEPLEVTIGFEDASTELSAEGIERLREIMVSPQLIEGAKIYIGAHTDSAGTDAVNMSVSRKRGEAVSGWFMEQGIAAERITLVPFGEQNPVQPNALPDGSPNEAGRRANRRVEVRVDVAPEAITSSRSPTLAEALVDQSSGGKAPSQAREDDLNAIR